ncbi:alpha hydrolase [Methanofollis aquaemaris]|uniref:Alpha hydrolase n=1 Tax=Methanofollis aquaemaris TaxID=126734 RepID=A0A8A3S4X3_9EURY|nr:alpha hydrolase [Methanofollis aquaemaris]QSZ66740.1 alpha hydrolase [Methanofollis aquaemaris]
MKAGLLFSGGKDSALAAVLLSRDYEVELNTFVFDPLREVPSVEAAARALGFPWRKWSLGPECLVAAAEQVVRDGHPCTAITAVHRRAVRLLAKEYEVVADGTRLNDRVPMLTRGDAMSLADRYGCSYVRPLLGFGKAEVQRLAARHLCVAYGETGTIENGDYEYEIRAAVGRMGQQCAELFPARHEQSLVTGATGT